MRPQQQRQWQRQPPATLWQVSVTCAMLRMHSRTAAGASCFHQSHSHLCILWYTTHPFACEHADLLSGVYHWGVDNYGDGSTPVFGSQIAGFQVGTLVCICAGR